MKVDRWYKCKPCKRVQFGPWDRVCCEKCGGDVGLARVAEIPA